MKPRIVWLMCLVGCWAALSSSAATRPTVIAKFGGECEGASFQPTAKLASLIRSVRARQSNPCESTFCDGSFAYDLNGDGRNEHFVRLACGATGNCTWGVFSDRPAKLRGTFTAWFFYIQRRSGSWNPLTTYTREGGDQGVIATLRNHRGRYVQTTERTERGYYGNWQPFLKRMGVPKCS